MVFPLALLLLQAPHPEWMLTNGPPREVKRVYWDLGTLQTTQIWVYLVPEDPGGKSPLVALIFQAFFPGRAKREPYSWLVEWPKGAPSRLALRAQPLPLTLVIKLSLQLVIDGNATDLTGPGSRCRYLCVGTAGGDCALNAVEAEIEPSLLQSLVTAQTLRGEALGFLIELREADQLALAEFAKRIGLSREKGNK